MNKITIEYRPQKKLAKAEQKLFELLYMNVGKVVTHKMIADTLIGEGCYHMLPNEYSRPLVRRLRRKLGKGAIETVRGKGYVLVK